MYRKVIILLFFVSLIGCRYNNGVKVRNKITGQRGIVKNYDKWAKTYKVHLYDTDRNGTIIPDEEYTWDNFEDSITEAVNSCD